MDHESLQPIMLTLALATPLVGGCLLWVGRLNAAQAGEPLPTAIQRAALLLLVAGPLNLLVWFLFNEWLDAAGYRSAVGYVLAALVFVGMGWSSGMFTRRRRRRPGGVRSAAAERQESDCDPEERVVHDPK